MLEEIQMPVALGHRIVNRMLTVSARHCEARARRKVHADHQRARRCIEIGPRYKPRGTDPQRCLKQLFYHRNPPTESRPRH